MAMTPYTASYDWKVAWQQERRQNFRLVRQVVRLTAERNEALRRVDELELQLAMAQAQHLAEA